MKTSVENSSSSVRNGCTMGAIKSRVLWCRNRVHMAIGDLPVDLPVNYKIRFEKDHTTLASRSAVPLLSLTFKLPLPVEI